MLVLIGEKLEVMTFFLGVPQATEKKTRIWCNCSMGSERNHNLPFIFDVFFFFLTGSQN